MRYSQLVSISEDNQQSEHMRNCMKMLNEDFNSHQAQLQFLASQLEEQEELLLNRINSVISFEPAVEIIIRITSVWAELCSKINQKKDTEMKIQNIAARIRQFEAFSQAQKQKTLKFKDNMYQHVMAQVKSIEKLFFQAQKHSIKKIVQSNVSQFVYSTIYESRKCCHGRKKQNSAAVQCQGNCQFSELFHFLKQYKSENLYNKFKEMWFMMEKQLAETINFYRSNFGNGLEQLKEQVEQTNLQQQIERSNNEQMALKVDLQILKCQIRRTLKNAGFPYQNLGQQFIAPNLSNIFHSILSDFLKGQKSSKQFFHRNKTVSQELGCIFYDYVWQMTQQYLKENGTINEPRKCEQRVHAAALDMFQEAFQQSISVFSQKQQLEIRIRQMQQQMQKIKQLYLKLRSINQHGKSEEFMNCEQTTLSNHKKLQKHQKGLSAFCNTKRVSFQVIKSMHISAVSNLVSAAPSHANNKVTSLSARQNYQVISGVSNSCLERNSQLTNYRLLEFGSNKLILKKQIPHIHEEIQIKRVKGIKTIGRSTVNVYFKKGYMSLQLLSGPQIKGKSCKKQIKIGSNGVTVARQWLKCFRTEYYQHIDNISFSSEEDKLMAINEAKINKLTHKTNQNQADEYHKQNAQLFKFNTVRWF